jgi:putative heme-binding domain-containing protein
VPSLESLLRSDRDETLALRDLWALHVSGGLDDQIALNLLGHSLAGVRRWTIRLLGDDGRMSSDLRSKLVTLAAQEPDSQVRSQLASSCQRWETADALPILGRLARRDEDRKDTHIPNLIWWAFERQLRRDRAAVLSYLSTAEAQKAPLVCDAVLERTARVLASEASDSGFAACVRLLLAAPQNQQVSSVLAGMDKGLEGRTLTGVPAQLVEALLRIWERSQPAPSLILVRLLARMGYRPAIEAAVKLAGEANAPLSERISLIELIGQLARPEDASVLVGLLRSGSGESIALAAIPALANFPQSTAAASLLNYYPAASVQARDRILALLCSRPAWAKALLQAMASGRIAAKELKPAHVQLVTQLSDPALVDRLEAIWGKVPRVGSPEKKKRIAEIRGLLPEGDKGNAARGKPIFKESCAVCHKLFNEGETIGPDLTGAERGDLDFLMTSLVDPSALVRKEYQGQSVALRDGRVINGLVVDENDRQLTLVDSNRQKTVIARDSIEEIKASDVSVMPEGLLDKLTEPQIRDLFRYLQSQGVP